MSDLASIIGERIRKLRKKMDMSQHELALRAGIDRSYMGKIERGEINITLEKFQQIAIALEVELIDVLKDE
ncbi:MAG: helix-turn-helix transcriptional regulator [Gammaproteobacteria bacterium]